MYSFIPLSLALAEVRAGAVDQGIERLEAFIARITRSSVLEVLDQDYVRTAEAKGMPPLVIHYRHVLRNALVPVITIIGAGITLKALMQTGILQIWA